MNSASNIRIGFCTPQKFMLPGTDRILTDACETATYAARLAAHAGFDYMEYNVAYLMSLRPDALDALCRINRTLDTPIETANGYFPVGLSLYRNSWTEIEDYVAESLRRMALLGVDTVVFGSGNARNIPDGMDTEQASVILTRFLHLLLHYCRNHGVTPVIEPLNHHDCNCLCTLADGADFILRNDLSDLGLMADSFHMHIENESTDHLTRYASLIRHIHICDNDRHFCGRTDREHPDAFLHALISSGYCSRISLECIYDSFPADLSAAASYLQKHLH